MTPPGSGHAKPRPRKRPKKPGTLLAIGWREWVVLPEMSPVPVKAKVDTGARTSALHAFALDVRDTDEGPIAEFELHPVQRSAAEAVRLQCPVVAFRKVRSSNGRVETRPVIETAIEVGDQRWLIDVTLTSRDAMGFRMLLGRAAVRGRFVVNPGRSFLHGYPASGPVG